MKNFKIATGKQSIVKNSLKKSNLKNEVRARPEKTKVC